jgi:membrane associated rhomboid family serine protease
MNGCGGYARFSTTCRLPRRRRRRPRCWPETQTILLVKETNYPMVSHLRHSLLPVLGAFVLLWSVEVLNLLMGHQLGEWGILPRTMTGLRGIPLSPFLHANLSHLLVNSLPFLVLGGLVALQGRRVFLGVSLVVIICGGIALWLFGRTAYHIGASGLIFGYFGYLVARAWYDRSVSSILMALVALFLYGGLVWGVLPTNAFISWEGHLFGLLAGILAARIQGRGGKVKPTAK